MTKSHHLVWDLPTRVLHWMLTGGLTAGFLFAQIGDEHSALFSWHMVIGIIVGLLVVMRLFWGIAGSRYARFNSFVYSPASVIRYVWDAFRGQDQRHVGHNPGSSYAIWAMLFLSSLTCLTGLMMAFGVDAGEELHSVCAYALAAVIVVHVVGVVWYSIRHAENITLSMIRGTKACDARDSIPSNHTAVGIVFLLAAVLLTASLVQNFDQAASQTKLPFLNIVIPLGEHEDDDEHDD
jgi:cytochrome b